VVTHGGTVPAQFSLKAVPAEPALQQAVRVAQQVQVLVQQRTAVALVAVLPTLRSVQQVVAVPVVQVALVPAAVMRRTAILAVTAQVVQAAAQPMEVRPVAT